MAGRILLLVALIALTLVVVRRFTDLRQFINILSTGKWPWIASGLFAHAVYFYCYAFLYKLGFDAVGVESRTSRLFPLVFAGIFVNAVLPTGGAGGAAIFIDDAARRGQSGARAAVGVILVLMADLVTLLPFLAWGFGFLAVHRDLKFYDTIGLILFAAYIGALLAALFYAHRRPEGLARFLDRIRRLADRIGRHFHTEHLISEEWPNRTADELNQAAHALVERPKRLGTLAGWGIVVHIINAAGIWALAQAFREAVPLGGIVAVFGIAIVFFIVSPVPQGIAVVEAVITLVLTSLGVPKATAVTIALVFRGANFWFPLIVGTWFAWRLRSFGLRSAPKAAEPETQ